MYVKYLSRFCWLLVGVVFIFSGLIKLNDPVGTAIKLEEYFEVFAEDFGHFFLLLQPYSRTFSIVLSAAEVVLGAALLLRWQLHIVLRVLLGLTVFFGFLTFYSAAFNKVTDCGCFGDAIKLTPWTSFTKDMVLMAAILVLLRTYERWLKEPLTRRPLIGTLLVTTVAGTAIGIGVYALGHLPIFDLLPYKRGNDIGALMKARAPMRYAYTLEKAGEEITTEAYPTDTAYHFKAMKVLNPEDGPKITDFRVWNDAGDYTQEFLKGIKLVLVIQGLDRLDRDRLPQTAQLLQQAARSRLHIEPVIITSASQIAFDQFRHEKNLTTPYYFVDATVLKTMIRANPGLILLRDGKVLEKWHYHDFPTLRGVEKILDR